MISKILRKQLLIPSFMKTIRGMQNFDKHPHESPSENFGSQNSESEKKEQPKLSREEEAKREEMIRARVFTGIELPHVPRPEQVTEPLQVHSLSNGGFMVNKQWVPGSILIFPKRCFIWGVTQPREIKPHTLELLKYLKPKPRISFWPRGDIQEAKKIW